MSKKLKVVDYCDDVAWYLPEKCMEKIVWHKRKRLPKWFINLLNGDKVSIKLNFKGWKWVKGSCK